MSNDAVQMSLDPSLAPDLPMIVIDRNPNLWKPVRTAVSGIRWHKIRRTRGGTSVVTMCDLTGHKVAKTGVVFTPCPECLLVR